MATTKMAFSGGLNSSSGGELKLYLRCTGSTNGHQVSDFLQFRIPKTILKNLDLMCNKEALEVSTQ